MHIGMANRPFEASHSRGTVRPMLERMGLTLTEKKNKNKNKEFLSVDNTLRDLHNTSDDMKAKFNNCVIIHSK